MKRSKWIKRLFDRLNRLKIRTRLLICFFMVIIFSTLLIVYFTFVYYSKVLEEKTIVYVQDSLASVNNSIEGVLSRVEDISFVILSNEDIEDIYTDSYKTDDYEKSVIRTKVLNILASNFTAYSNIKNITILSEDNHVYNVGISGSSGTILDPKIIRKSLVFKELEDTDGSIVIYTGSEGLLPETAHQGVKIYIARKIMSKYKPKLVIGYMFIELVEDKLKDIYNTKFWNNSGLFMMVDQQGQLISEVAGDKSISDDIIEACDGLLGGKYDGSYIDTINQEKVLVTQKTSEYSSWRLISVISYSYIISEWIRLRNLTLVIAAGCMVLSFIISVLFSIGITNPVKKLVVAMKKAGIGDFSVVVKIDRKDEIGELSDIFNKMIFQINELIQNIHYEQNLKKESEIKLLQYQINPHFFYNTLDTLNWMAESANQEKMVTIITSMSKLFRISLSKGKDIITIRQEIEHVECYLTIQKIRMGDMLQYDINVEKEVLNNKTVKLILQPLVENAVNHGIYRCTYEGFIRISCRKKKDNIVFEVYDNGVGISEDMMDSLEKYIYRKVEDTKEFGFGLRNINDRIRLTYGKLYGLTFVRGLSSGTIIRVVIPAE